MSTPEGTDQQSTVQQAGSAPDGNTSGQTSTANDGFKPPATQEELNRIIADRVAREKVKLDRELEKFKDVPDLRKKAAEYDKLVDAQKTELQKIQERAEAAEAKAAEFEAREQKRIADAEQAKQVADWKTKISEATGVPANLIRGSTEEDLKAHAEELKALLPDPHARRGGGAYVPAEGRETGKTGTDPGQLFGSIITSQLK